MAEDQGRRPTKKHRRPIKVHHATLTQKSDQQPVEVSVDYSARLKEIRQLVNTNNRSTLDDNLIICQIYMESRFDAQAGAGHDAKGLMQMQNKAVQQVFKYRKQKELGHMPSDQETAEAFSEGEKLHDGSDILDEATNIQIGTDYMQYWLDVTPNVEAAYKKYRGRPNGIYYSKINLCAAELEKAPDSIVPLQDMVKSAHKQKHKKK
jgi:hypothetical protein